LIDPETDFFGKKSGRGERQLWGRSAESKTRESTWLLHPMCKAHRIGKRGGSPSPYSFIQQLTKVLTAMQAKVFLSPPLVILLKRRSQRTVSAELATFITAYVFARFILLEALASAEASVPFIFQHSSFSSTV